MEYIPLVTLAGLSLILGGALVLVVLWCRSEVTARGVEQDGRVKAEEVRSKVERERDDEKAARVRAEVERDNARQAATMFEAAAAIARQELTNHVREKLVTGSDDDVAAEVDRLLSEATVRAVR